MLALIQFWRYLGKFPFYRNAKPLWVSVCVCCFCNKRRSKGSSKRRRKAKRNGSKDDESYFDKHTAKRPTWKFSGVLLWNLIKVESWGARGWAGQFLALPISAEEGFTDWKCKLKSLVKKARRSLGLATNGFFWYWRRRGQFEGHEGVWQAQLKAFSVAIKYLLSKMYPKASPKSRRKLQSSKSSFPSSLRNFYSTPRLSSAFFSIGTLSNKSNPSQAAHSRVTFGLSRWSNFSSASLPSSFGKIN